MICLLQFGDFDHNHLKIDRSFAPPKQILVQNQQLITSVYDFERRLKDKKDHMLYKYSGRIPKDIDGMFKLVNFG